MDHGNRNRNHRRPSKFVARNRRMAPRSFCPPRKALRRNRIDRMLLIVGLFVLFAAIRSTNASSSQQQQQVGGATKTVAGGQSKNGPLPKFPLAGIAPDPFVQSSPLIVGVVCSDGVLLVALHSIFSTENVESPLLQLRESFRDENNGTGTGTGTDHTESRSNKTDPPVAFQKDLPRKYRGPFRIHSVDSSGTSAMVCAGWRTDCQNLVNHVRSIDRREEMEFGDKVSRAPEYGSFLASRASLLLAKFCVSESRRPLSCLGLLASGSSSSSSSSSNSSSGQLWVVDSTGAYRVRALAVGRGSDKVNEILRKTDWTQKESAEVKNELLHILYDDSGNDDNANEIQIPKESCIEMAVVETTVDEVPKRMKRLFTSV